MKCQSRDDSPKRWRWRVRPFLLLAGLGLLGCPNAGPVTGSAAPPNAEKISAAATPRDPRWAVPIPNQPGLPNLHMVNDHLYRGAQPEDEGYATLKKLGIKTVVNLRAFHDDRKQCDANGLQCIEIPLLTWDIDHGEIEQFLRAVHDPKNWPVFVHCQHGADRTGLMCAVARIADEGWTKDQAIKEMTEGGYGYHVIWKNIIRTVEKLNVERMRQTADDAPTTAGAVGR